MESTIRNQVTLALGVLVNLPIQSAGRTGNLFWIHFGSTYVVDDRKGTLCDVGEFALHIQCAWRIVQDESIFVGSGDLFYPAGDPFDDRDDFEWDRPGANRCDERIEQLIEHARIDPPVVESLSVDSTGGFRLVFGRHALEAIPDTSVIDEHWRLFRPIFEDRHLVFSGVEFDNCELNDFLHREQQGKPP